MGRAPQLAAPGQAVLAIAAHPDDIEFLMAGTLLLLARRGWRAHYFNLSSGNCGSMNQGPAATRRIRRKEAQCACKKLGAQWHADFLDDLEIFYADHALRRIAAVIREVAPRIILTHSPQDYMEDHMATCRLTVSAAFVRGMPNYRTVPQRAPQSGEVTIYHSLPHGLRDQLRQPIQPELLIDTTSVHEVKRAALAAHRSQKEWLDATQGMESYLLAMDAMSEEVARKAGRFRHAEGWHRHSHLGFSAADADPLRAALPELCILNPEYEGISSCA